MEEQKVSVVLFGYLNCGKTTFLKPLQSLPFDKQYNPSSDKETTDVELQYENVTVQTTITEFSGNAFTCSNNLRTIDFGKMGTIHIFFIAQNDEATPNFFDGFSRSPNYALCQKEIMVLVVTKVDQKEGRERNVQIQETAKENDALYYEVSMKEDPAQVKVIMNEILRKYFEQQEDLMSFSFTSFDSIMSCRKGLKHNQHSDRKLQSQKKINNRKVKTKKCILL
ncbi:hypothetical protein EHI8A_022260 [Entamoeba histolytica HM-1:IMSS-B]|uniref:Ras family protein n=6 Tax=Entamoeba histolytica TaxID=5759 RepID=C4LWV0_ENTH1|nr:hypothetical protein EHI_199040 [Entamoeba histolytica HM-1:IMSS]EMD43540.1 Hypothetical protein EHI5A_045780 [Entamoeba histolytica KU27]EMH74655.1 hypothetical protein EHI8A_022260 [Entamoeba histolytica HM-1:IMSS-B]EMS16255.1 hypothetical protein KM1_024740 [Entamoeba histolytica HM-3:IMSS]ENY63199.1 hypothetical protein EHI7A_025070 [Entamoeba histolytica HM-1:IMSS-A]GAT93193.1 hypothetical protein CL6EHI_199040 [Entamoeba histolytica]|eukprot:XP_653287.1 hypothetical protein EHI_199040 [Entamoeba histolytica HM-1:IMSS]